MLITASSFLEASLSAQFLLSSARVALLRAGEGTLPRQALYPEVLCFYLHTYISIPDKTFKRLQCFFSKQLELTTSVSTTSFTPFTKLHSSSTLAGGELHFLKIIIISQMSIAVSLHSEDVGMAWFR